MFIYFYSVTLSLTPFRYSSITCVLEILITTTNINLILPIIKKGWEITVYVYKKTDTIWSISFINTINYTLVIFHFILICRNINGILKVPFCLVSLESSQQCTKILVPQHNLLKGLLYFTFLPSLPPSLLSRLCYVSFSIISSQPVG